MSDDNVMIEIEDLYVNFYTQAGIVKALDGVTLAIRKGETLGLVGETGCGKSVTANSVMRLIPIPPGKIEKGHIFFLRPTGSAAEIAAADKKLTEAMSKAGEKTDAQKVSALQRELQDLKQRAELRNQIQTMSSGPDDPMLAEAKKKLNQMDSKYDLLARSPEYMQKIRGKYISMIFQEPMTALNPVFTAGDQIAEIVLLHEKRELAESVIVKIDEELKAVKTYFRVKKNPNDKGENTCSNCRAVVMPESFICPQCGGSFDARHFRSIRGMSLRYYRSLYARMVTNPNDWTVRAMAKVPIVRRYRRRLNAEAIDRADRMLRLVRIPDPANVVKSYPFELSGGMQQRVMIAMALACKPQLLIADEPTTALDVTIQAQILKLMRDLQEQTGTSILLITHNLGVVAEVCDRVGVMYAGTIAEIGPKMDIFKEPLHPYTQGLMNSIPKVNMDMTRLETIEGSVPNLSNPPSGCRFHPRCPYAMEKCKEIKPQMVEVRPGHFTACHLYTGVRR
jgi:peptide/nickel transport system ATP-binding protein